MNNSFFAKLAVRNIRSNSQVYLPYTLSSICVVMMFYLVYSLMTNEFVQTRSTVLPSLFSIGTIVVGIFSLIFILYSNSFLIKRRKKEIGLYALLGLEKKHVAKVLFIEIVLISVVSIGFGVVAGQVAGKLSFMSLNYFLNFPVSMDYPVSLTTILVTGGMFFFIFLLALLYNLSQVTFSNPIKLLKGKSEGEKEPKSSVILFILSIVCLGAGYGISLSVADPLTALLYFFIAVLLVILGTYFFFVSGSIFILKTLKKNKNFYYRPGNFISISGMIYRMKQNAVGLANICILITMVVIAIATTYAIFSGTEEVLESRFPYENNLSVSDLPYEDSEVLDELDQSIQSRTEGTGLEIADSESFRYQTLYGFLEEGTFLMENSNGNVSIPQTLMMIPLSDYQRLLGETIELGADQLLIYMPENPSVPESVTFGSQTFQAEQLDEFPLSLSKSQNVNEYIFIVLPDSSTISEISAEYQQDNPESIIDGYEAMAGWNTNGTTEEKQMYADQVAAYFAEDSSVYYESREDSREEWYSMNGGFLFLGIFLGLLFTLGTVLITYFKQISEGFDDRSKFKIMQKVGLDKKMIKDSTKAQMLWMFFLPLLMAAVHVAFAYPILQKMLIVFGITNKSRVIASIIGVILAFSLIYWVIYRITSRVYFNIVKE